MALPLMGSPEFFCNIPSTGEQVKFRPFTVKEQKAMLFALQSLEPRQIIDAVETTIGNCVQTDTKKLASFDIEYLFLQIRGKSVGERIELNLKHGSDNPCEAVTPYELNLEDVVMSADGIDNNVQISPDMSVALKFPSFSNLEKYAEIFAGAEQLIEFLASSIQAVYTTEDVYRDFTEEEAKEWVESLTPPMFDKVVDWFNQLPQLVHNIEYTCQECGQIETVTLRGINDFFMFV